MSQLQRAAFVYTPQVLLQGRDFRAWGTPAFDDAVAAINARPAGATIALRIDSIGKDRIQAEVRAQARGVVETDTALYVAAYENKLVSQVAAGENRGHTLAHDYVVLEWHGDVDSSVACSNTVIDILNLQIAFFQRKAHTFYGTTRPRKCAERKARGDPQ